MNDDVQVSYGNDGNKCKQLYDVHNGLVRTSESYRVTLGGMTYLLRLHYWYVETDVVKAECLLGPEIQRQDHLSIMHIDT